MRVLIVDDNGIGFNVKEIIAKKTGLQKVKQMIENLKGDIILFSNRDRTVVHIEIPLEENNE